MTPHETGLRENPPRQGFFEHPEYLAVRAHLPAPWQDILDLAYLPASQTLWQVRCAAMMRSRRTIRRLCQTGFVRLTLRAAQCRDAHSTIPLLSASLSA